MADMADHYPCQRSNGYFDIIGRASAGPIGKFQVRKKHQISLSKQSKLNDQLSYSATVRMRVLNIAVLFESLDRRLITAGNAKNAIGKHSLAIDDMAKYLFDRPFAITVSVSALFFRYAVEQLRQFIDLCFKGQKNIFFRNERDIFLIVRVVFGGLWT